MLRYLAIPVVIISLLTTACQTSMLKQFSKIEPGMEKDDVLRLMGSPKQTQRFHGKDRWSYVFYDNRIKFEKEVQFFEGNAIYVGDKWQPEKDKTAAAIDGINDQKNQQIDEQIAKDVEAHRRSYEAYEKEAKGEDKVRYVPDFEAIR
ncbi:outer membrane protein assembly factor BamE [Bdellovibrio sp. 22V]|uniref:outer membrane protein assembly factor BamE domain-containing protein n=1 Tax=Bdellovibrio TaxID=958 RepID=UPI00254271B8|nr:outer membrane protein assembly factor BamE [Bdellovibrio sp. 22V]WII72093.1 outer membrane protein assembly factor BamE [Bdellovibrio sp. 22V]